MKVLAVDDDLTVRLIVQTMVLSLGHDCLLAADATDAWQILERGGVDVVITDRMMPRVDGLDLCRRIRDLLPDGYIYVVLATGLGAREQVLEGMLAGADDYLVKPISRHDLQLRLTAGERVTALHRQLEKQKQELRLVARRDPLTGLRNRARLQEDLQTLAGRVTRHGHRYGVALLDVDLLKPFNDLYGHSAGDRVLQAVGKSLTAAIRAGDVGYRYGGGSFLCVFPEQSGAGVAAAVQRILDGMVALSIPHGGSPVHGRVTLSAGIAELSPEHSDPGEVLQEGDAALHRAKAAGRNTVRLSTASVPRPRRQMTMDGAGALPLVNAETSQAGTAST